MPWRLKNFFLLIYLRKSELDTLNFAIVISFNNCCRELQDENQIDETLMNKGFQRVKKKNRNEMS